MFSLAEHVRDAAIERGLTLTDAQLERAVDQVYTVLSQTGLDEIVSEAVTEFAVPAPSVKQEKYVERIIAGLGEQMVRDYFLHHFPKGDFANMTKVQAQKIITGMGHRIAGPISGVAASMSWVQQQ